MIETEAGFLQAVKEAAQWAGWLTYHTHRSDRSDAGFPDLCMIRGERIIFAELKSERGRVSSFQKVWLEALSIVAGASHGVESYLWRPSDFPAIEAVLAVPRRVGASP